MEKVDELCERYSLEGYVNSLGKPTAMMLLIQHYAVELYSVYLLFILFVV